MNARQYYDIESCKCTSSCICVHVCTDSHTILGVFVFRNCAMQQRRNEGVGWEIRQSNLKIWGKQHVCYPHKNTIQGWVVAVCPSKSITKLRLTFQCQWKMIVGDCNQIEK